LKKEFSIDDHWLGYQLRPETPPEGRPVSDLFPGIDLAERYERLNQAGAPFGVEFAARTQVSNSRLALEAGEFARDAGRHHSFHTRIFHAYFTDNLNIGDMTVILRLAEEEGLDGDDLTAALQDGRYGTRLEEARDEAQQYGVNAVPTFIINGKAKIVGAQSLDVFRNEFKQIQAEKGGHDFPRGTRSGI
jgi:predicted DsbA family dithiol-disulfide isomerase